VLLQVARLLATSDPERSAKLAGAAIAFAERAGLRFPPRYGRAADQLHEDLRGRLGATRAEDAWTEGSQLSTLEAVDLAVTESRPDKRSKRVTTDQTLRSNPRQ
jgi:hypothetical protein